MGLMVNEIFVSVQGEGLHTGLPVVFIRLSGCNLSCSWCDTKYASGPESGVEMDIEEIVNRVSSEGLRSVCITGGEPLAQGSLPALLRALKDEGYMIDIETNGSFDVGALRSEFPDIMFSMDVKTPSSGQEGSFVLENLHHLRGTDQLKFIVRDSADLEFALDFIRLHPFDCSIVLTPCHNEGAKELVHGLLNELKKPSEGKLLGIPWDRIRVMLQMHKVIWGKEARGV